MNRVESIKKRYEKLIDKPENPTVFEGFVIHDTAYLLTALDKCRSALEKYEACMDFNMDYTARDTLKEVFGE